MLIAGVVLLLISNLFPAPIERPISPTMTDLPNVRAPWFFLWVQQLLKLGDAFFYGVAVPVLLLLALGILPYALPQAADHEFGRWFPHGNRLAQIVLLLIALMVSVLTILAVLPTTHL